MLTIQFVNEMKKSSFVQHFGGVYEHSLWVAERAAHSRPFSSIRSLHEQMVLIVRESSVSDQLALLRNHPNLGARIKMTDSSVKEQASAGLTALSEGEFTQFSMLNKAYTEKFDFPFIIAVRGKSKEEISMNMEKRLENDKKTEFDTALNEVFKIAHFRIRDIVAAEKEPSECLH
ncbi:2-oxo-4-hydroxy-4-carboxy-5-ureidoimidazoline decarboxylase [Domibacillus indicus]|uniref:2-oxo-4-hydroxy-4-carboxy-5-ureidoimidazoline decarboxylase n=1 Tax=Domibacillus indicus TaxID=1437523 RepID=UPI000ADCB66D